MKYLDKLYEMFIKNLGKDVDGYFSISEDRKHIAQWVSNNTGGSGDVSYPDLMCFLAKEENIDKALEKLKI